MHPRDRTWAEVVASRRSAVDYTGEIISRDLVRDIVAEATMAPSAFNSQPWRFVVVQGDDLEAFENVLGGNHGKVRSAGTMVAVFADLDEVTGGGARADYYDRRTARTPEEFGVRNASLGAMALMFAAWSHGVATRPMIGFDAERLGAVAGVPDAWHPVMVVALGWPAGEEPGPRQRRPLDEVLHFGPLAERTA